MDEQERRMRAAIVAEAETWIGTPYISNAVIKGRRGGTDCGMLLIGVYGALGFVPKEFDPRPYAPDWHVHRNEEKYIEFVERFATEVDIPPKRIPLPGDLMMFHIGRVFAHAAIITDWPNAIHAVSQDSVLPVDILANNTGKRALANVPWRVFSPRSFDIG